VFGRRGRTLRRNRSRGGPVSSTPGELSATWWLRGSGINIGGGVWADARGTLDFTLEGSPATVTRGGQVGLDCAAGDGAASASDFSLTRPLSLAMVLRLDAVSGNHAIFNVDNHSRYQVQTVSDDLFLQDGVYDIDTREDNVLTAATAHTIIFTSSSAAGNTLYIDGATYNAPGGVGLNPAAAPAHLLLTAASGGPTGAAGEIYDVSCFGSALSGSDLTGLQNYLDAIRDAVNS